MSSPRLHSAGVALALVALVAARTWPVPAGSGPTLPTGPSGSPLAGACAWVAELAPGAADVGHAGRPLPGETASAVAPGGAAAGRGEAAGGLAATRPAPGASGESPVPAASGPGVGVGFPRPAGPGRNETWAVLAALLPARGVLATAGLVRVVALLAGAAAAFLLARALAASVAGSLLAAAVWTTAAPVGGPDLVGQPWLPLAAWGALALLAGPPLAAAGGGAVLGAAAAAASATTPGGGFLVTGGAAAIAWTARRRPGQVPLESLADGNTSRARTRPEPGAGGIPGDAAPEGGAASRAARVRARATARAGKRERPARAGALLLGLAVAGAVWLVVRVLLETAAVVALGPGTAAAPLLQPGEATWRAVAGLAEGTYGVPRLGPAALAAVLSAAVGDSHARRLAVLAAALTAAALLPGAPAWAVLPPALLAAGTGAACGIGALRAPPARALSAAAGVLGLLAVARHHERERPVAVPVAVRAVGSLSRAGRVLFVPVDESPGLQLVWEAIAGREAALARLSEHERGRLQAVAPDALRLARGAPPSDVRGLSIDLDLLAVDHVVVDPGSTRELSAALDALDRWERGPIAEGQGGWWYRRSLAPRLEALAGGPPR